MKYIIVLVVAFCMSVMSVSGEQVDRTAQPMQATTVKQVHSESGDVSSDASDISVTANGAVKSRSNSEIKSESTDDRKVIKSDDTFHVNSSHTPDHVIGQGGLEMPDSTDKKTTRYSDTDAVNSALQAVVMTGVHSAMHGSKAKPWMQRTVLSLRFQKNWKPLYGVETLQPLGHYDETSRHVWFTQERLANAADTGTTANVGIGYRRIAENDDHYYGGNLFYDHRFRGNHGRMSVGLEYVSGIGAFRMNWYRGVSGERSLDGVMRLESVSNGYTAEYGTSFKNARWARVYMEAYRWQLRRSEDKHGLRIGTELQLTPRISVDMGYNKPEHEHGSPYGKVMFRLAGVDTAWFGGNHRSDTKTSVRANMLENVRRQHTVYVD